MKKQNELKKDDIVMYSRNFLRSIGEYTGDLCFCEGKIIRLIPMGDSYLAEIDWNIPGIPLRVNVCNLKLKNKYEIE